MPSVYFVFAHPRRHRSRANATILERVSDLPNVTVMDLYETYPDFNINVEREKTSLMAHDVLFLQHPFFWYSMPPLLKLWMDEVLQFGFAYGPGGNALAAKTLQLSITAGGPQEAYCDRGANRFTTEEFTRAYEQTAYLCQMKWAKSHVLFAADRVSQDEIEAHAESVRDLILSYTNPSYRPERSGI